MAVVGKRTILRHKLYGYWYEINTYKVGGGGAFVA
jgi:hypothetical protein